MARYKEVEGDDGLLGHGSSGSVAKVIRESDGQTIVLRGIRNRERANREWSILSKLDHPNIVRCVDILWTKKAARIYMGYCAGGSLADFIASKTSSKEPVLEGYVLSIFHQTSAALLYCHEGPMADSTMSSPQDWKPLLHRDIKPGNILLSSGDETEQVVAKLADFGLSIVVNEGRDPSTYAGTKKYLAPEIELVGSRWTEKSDIFSLGCTMYELCKLRPPFPEHMKMSDISDALPDCYSSRLKDCIAACISYQPKHRPSATKLLVYTQQQKIERLVQYEAVQRAIAEDLKKYADEKTDLEERVKAERLTKEELQKSYNELKAESEKEKDVIKTVASNLENEKARLESQYKKIKEESDNAWIELHAEATRKTEEEKARADRLQKSYNELKTESEKEKDVIKTVANSLENEKARLDKLIECYGDVTEIKSKDDTYYLVSFSQLQKQIMDLAATHFVHLPVTPPPGVLAQIPSGLPSFLGDTTASRQLRAAYITHTISKLITYRVAGPFLFTLGRRYDKADSLFRSMSDHIRDKSTRKEAIWRQQTLLAAFTSSGAKQRINTAAGTVVEEIVNSIKSFADPREEEGIKIAVKRIVKLAAETWRFARLEREMISATMPAPQDKEHVFTGPEFWPAYKPEGTLIPSLVGTSEPSGEPPKLLLRLFPVIVREPKHENFRSSEDEKPDEGCVYHHGLALYDDAEPVVNRVKELKSTGLPLPSSPKPPPSERSRSRSPCTRPIPGPVDFSTPIDAPPLPEPTESIISPPFHVSNPLDVPPPPPPTDSVIIPPPPAPTPAPGSTTDLPLPTSTESTIIPPSMPRQIPNSELSGKNAESQSLPTPPRSQGATPPTERPVSLYATDDEISTLTVHRSRNSSMSSHSSSTRHLNEELRKDRADKGEPFRQTSGYTPGSRSRDASQGTEQSGRSSSSRYMCESRSGSIKGLYPNSPLAGQPPSLSRTNLLRSGKGTMGDSGTLDTNSQAKPILEPDPELVEERPRSPLIEDAAAVVRVASTSSAERRELRRTSRRVSIVEHDRPKSRRISFTGEEGPVSRRTESDRSRTRGHGGEARPRRRRSETKSSSGHKKNEGGLKALFGGLKKIGT